MTSTLLNNELTNLLSEAKRKHPELRSAAEKSLQELKGLPATSEQQLAAGKTPIAASSGFQTNVTKI
jgi:hypothetical protein